MKNRVLTNRIFIHSTASDNPDQDNLEAVTELHTSGPDKHLMWGKYSTTGKSFSTVGYHFLITKNPCEIVIGRDMSLMGAGVYGHNSDSIHIALCGNKEFSEEQFEELRICLDSLYMVYPNLNDTCVFGHREVNPAKECPGFSVNEVLIKHTNSYIN